MDPLISGIVDINILYSSSQIMHISVRVIEKEMDFLASFIYAFLLLFGQDASLGGHLQHCIQCARSALDSPR